MRGYYESAPFKQSEPNVNPGAVEAVAVEPSLRSRFYGAGSQSAQERRERDFEQAQAIAKRVNAPEAASPAAPDRACAVYHLAGPVFVEVEYEIKADCSPSDPEANNNGWDYFGEVYPRIV